MTRHRVGAGGESAALVLLRCWCGLSAAALVLVLLSLEANHIPVSGAAPPVTGWRGRVIY